jgi:hypothetical protein
VGTLYEVLPWQHREQDVKLPELVSSPEFEIEEMNKAYDFHVPDDEFIEFCSLSSGQTVFIRESYKILTDWILEPPAHQTRVNGTPGIGKSVLGIYLIYRLAKEKRSGLYGLFPVELGHFCGHLQ